MITALQFPLLPPAEILALEEVLLDAAEAGEIGETLSFWESATHFIVLGYGNKVSTEVNQATCERLNIPILRRISGGGTVLQGPGVLNYSLVLRAEEGTPLASIAGANQFIMERNAEALTKILNADGGTRNAECETFNIQRPTFNADAGNTEHETRNTKLKVEVQGHTDLAIAGKKISGNAQRRKRTHLLFHGSILLSINLDLLEAALPPPSLQPDYRASRSHREFLQTFTASSAEVRDTLTKAWSAKVGQPHWESWLPRCHPLVEEKYGRREWNLRV